VSNKPSKASKHLNIGLKLKNSSLQVGSTSNNNFSETEDLSLLIIKILL